MDNENLKRITDALEEILQLVKKDLDAAAAYRKQQNEYKTRARNGPHLDQPLALAGNQRLQATSRKLQAPSCKLDKTGI